MVQRSLLAVILLLGLAGLFAQAQILPGLPPLRIPTGWITVYEPPVVSLRVIVDTDSTVLVAAVIDGKTELKALAEEHLTAAPLILYLPSGFTLPGLIEIDLPIVQEREARSTSQSNVPQMQQIDAWLDDYNASMDMHDKNNAITDEASPQTGYQHMQRSTSLESGGIRVFGIPLPESAIHTPVNASNLSAIYHSQQFGSDTNLTDHDYPFAAMFTSLDAGMGDYDTRHAQVKIMKNEVLGIKGLYYSGALLVANGWWEDANQAQTSMRHMFRFPVGKASLQIDYTAIDRDIAMTALKPAYWQNVNFALQQRQDILTIMMDSPWIDLAWLKYDESLSAQTFVDKLNTRMNTLRFSREFHLAALKLGTAYSHRFIADEPRIAANPFSFGHQDHVEFSATYSTSPAEITLNADAYDFDRYRVYSAFAWKMEKLYLGASYKADLGSSAMSAMIDNPYDPSTDLHYAAQHNTQQVALLAGADDWAGFAWRVEAGMKKIRQLSMPNLIVDELEASPAYAEASLCYARSFGPWEARYNQDIIWHQDIQGLRDNPIWKHRGVARLTRVLPHNNAIFAGFAITGHSDYISSAGAAYMIDASTMLDAFAGVRITRQFELQAELRNILDATLYGVSPIPLSAHVRLRWLYLN